MSRLDVVREEMKNIKQSVDRINQEVNKPEFKEGDWITNDGNESMLKINKIKGSWADVTGISGAGTWVNNGDAYIGRDHDLRHATDKEIEQALIKEYKRRGGKIGAKIKQYDTLGFTTVKSEPFLRDSGNLCVETEEAGLLWVFNPSAPKRSVGPWVDIAEEIWEVAESPIGGLCYVTDGDITIKKEKGRYFFAFKREQAEAIANALNNINQKPE